jgi:dihydroxy-acid dehydratase
VKKYSHIVSNNPSQPAAKAMLYGIGLSEKEINQAFIRIASTG